MMLLQAFDVFKDFVNFDNPPRYWMARVRCRVQESVTRRRRHRVDGRANSRRVSKLNLRWPWSVAVSEVVLVFHVLFMFKIRVLGRALAAIAMVIYVHTEAPDVMSMCHVRKYVRQSSQRQYIIIAVTTVTYYKDNQEIVAPLAPLLHHKKSSK